MVLERKQLFEPKLVSDLFSKVQGESSLAVLSNQVPIPFNGIKEFTFNMDKEIDIVAESGKKTEGGISIAPRKMVPIKFEYGARVSDEFLYAAEEEKINILRAFNDGFAKKVARGLDLAAFHGVNPRTGESSTVVGNNHFDKLVTQKAEAPSELTDANGVVESAISTVQGSGASITGFAMSPVFRSALSKQIKADGSAMFPDLAWGNAPSSVNGLNVHVNKTVSDMTKETVMGYIGDFRNAFKWGYAKQIPLEIIKYGDPDNSGLDLKGYNQIYIRAEVYLGWGILEPNYFSRIVQGNVMGDSE
ncbi:phage major capsid protein [Ignavigranum ruoffiae]